MAFWPSALRYHATKVCQKCGLYFRRNEKPGKHLPAAHPAVVHVKQWLSYVLEKGKYHPRLVGCFDQVWSLNFRPRRSVLAKFEARDEFSKFPSLRNLRHRMERVMGLPLTEGQVAEAGAPEGLCAIQGGSAAHAPPDQFRVPHTCTTLSWRDGDVGRAFLTCKDDALSSKQRCLLNEDPGFRPKLHCILSCASFLLPLLFIQELSQYLFIGPLQSRSHVWSSETFLSYMDFLELEVRARRRALGLGMDAACLIICDQAPQHSLLKFGKVKESWSKRTNITIWTGGSEEVTIPGGWGAAGSPNDGWRQALHTLRGAYARVAVDWVRSFEFRKNLDCLNMSLQSNMQTKWLGFGT